MHPPPLNVHTCTRAENAPPLHSHSCTRAHTSSSQSTPQIFQGMLSADGDSASVWSNLGNVHTGLGRPREAVQDYTAAISLAPEVTGGL